VRTNRGWWRVAAFVTAVVVVGAACSDDGSDDTDATDDGSTIVVGAEELPDVLNPLTSDTSWTSWLVGPALARGYQVQPDFTYEPWLFEDDCTVDSDEPFTVSCRIREDATWSDGTSVTADDFEFTYETMIDPDNLVWSTFGYEFVTTFDVTSPTEFSLTFDEPFAPYRDLWASGTAILPKHVLEGTDFNTVWNECICDPDSGDAIGSGPFLVESFQPDERVVLEKNDGYWDGEPKSDRVEFVLTPDTDAEVNELDAGDVDLIAPQESIDLRERIEAIDGAVFETGLGSSFEHLDLLTTTPGLDDPVVRQAIVTALPRQQIVDTVARPTNDDVTVLDNSIYVTNQAEYVPNWSIYPASGDLGAAASMLDAAGWVSDGGVRARDGVELSFTLGTTSGNEGRELAEQIIQEQLAEIDIAIEIENADDFFDRVDAFEYPMALYAFDATPDPSWAAEVYTTDGALNGTAQSNEEVDALLAQANTETDPDARAATVNAADRTMAESVVSVIPLYQKPAVIGLRGVTGVVINATLEGFTWNIEDWERSG